MLYLLQDGNHYKIGYSENEETLQTRIKSYKTHNPTFKYLGLREGTKENEKEYHKLLNCDKRSEWSCNIDDELIETIKLDFTLEAYLPSLFGSNIEIFKGEIIELYSTVKLILQNIINFENPTIIEIILCSNGIFIYSTTTKKLYKVINNNLNVQTFYYDYDINGEKYTGFIINDIIFYNFQKRMYTHNNFGNWIYVADNFELYNKLKITMENFKLITQDNGN